jgi:aspartyl-tRNA(Asn)/glutamyl-tRNA(Gln) amidotransferase subunit C
MKVTEHDVAHIAALASLELTSDERDRMLRDLNQILDHIDRLKEVDTERVPPMASAVSSGHEHGTALRADQTRPSLPHDDAMRNAPDSDGAYFRVPKVIER